MTFHLCIQHCPRFGRRRASDLVERTSWGKLKKDGALYLVCGSGRAFLASVGHGGIGFGYAVVSMALCVSWVVFALD